MMGKDNGGGGVDTLTITYWIFTKIGKVWECKAE
jgi:hypothetical protein